MPRTLLLADDSVTIQRVIELTFADEDIRVVAVGDGRKAIDYLQSQPVDIVLADVAMPEKDGYDVAAFVKRTPNLARVPVLLLTGAFEPIDEGRAREAGSDGVLVKPFEPQMVISRVKDLLGGRGDASAAPADDKPRPETMRAAVESPRPVPEVKPSMPSSQPASADEYFDRLDAAFAAFEPAADSARGPVGSPQPSAPGVPSNLAAIGDELAGWEPVLGDLLSEEPAARSEEPEARSEQPAAPKTEPTPTAAADGGTHVSLADAFAALLAAERGRPFDAPAAGALAQDDTLLDLVTRKVIERLGDRAMRDVVLDVAERLVREEIERIKSAATPR